MGYNTKNYKEVTNMIAMKNYRIVTYVLAASILGASTVAYQQLEEKEHKIEMVKKDNKALSSEVKSMRKDLGVSIEQMIAMRSEMSHMAEKIEATESENKKLRKQAKELTNRLKKNEEKVSKVSGKYKNVSALPEEKTSVNDSNGNWMNFTSTAYVSYCDTGCTGVTATGKNVAKDISYNGMRIIAVDPSVIPLYSIVQLNIDGKLETAIALDTGGAIKGKKIDYLIGVNNTDLAFKYGKKSIKIKILRNGKGV